MLDKLKEIARVELPGDYTEKWGLFKLFAERSQEEIAVLNKIEYNAHAVIQN